MNILSTVAGRTKAEWLSWAESKPKDLAAELVTLVNYAFQYVEQVGEAPDA